MPSQTATITFSQPGVQGPVYIVSSLSDPPWQILPMQIREKQGASEELVFERKFENVKRGTYQYKIRLGEDQWVIDENKGTATDEHGNRNNVFHVDSHDPAKPPGVPGEKKADTKDSRKDSTIDASAAHSAQRVPPVTVENADAGIEESYQVASELDAAPLFRHESIQVNEPNAQLALESVGREAGNFADDGRHSTDVIGTSAEANISRVDTALGNSNPNSQSGGDTQNLTENRASSHPAHEMAGDDGLDELSHSPLLRHETGLDNDRVECYEEQNELDHGPLFRHETNFSDDTDGLGNGHNELDAAPLLAHESGLAQNGTVNGTHEFDNRDDPDYNDPDDQLNEVPLLPHERNISAIHSESGSDHGEYDSFPRRRQLSFEDDMDPNRDIFHRHSIFRNRTNSSMLPHRLPQSDAEDENLHDPSLERFPTDRANILERVATIGLHLPEDQVADDPIHSPVMSVRSQACSSVDLIAVKSYSSLASVPEGDSTDEEEADVESLPSPVVFNFDRSQTSRIASDPHKTPMPDDSKRLGWGEGDSVEKIDAARNVPANIATPATMLKAVEARDTNDSLSKVKSADEKDAQAQRRAASSDSDSKDNSPPPKPTKNGVGEVKSVG